MSQPPQPPYQSGQPAPPGQPAHPGPPNQPGQPGPAGQPVPPAQPAPPYQAGPTTSPTAGPAGLPPDLPPGRLTAEQLAQVVAETPPKVAALANQRQFGPVINIRRGNNPIVMGGVGLGITVASFGLMALILGLVPEDVLEFLRFIGRMLCFVGVFGIGVIIAAIVHGFRVVYLYPNGLVQLRNGGLTALAWPEITSVTARIGKRKGNEGKIVAFDVLGHHGQKIVVPATEKQADDGFAQQLAYFVGRAGGRVS